MERPHPLPDAVDEAPMAGLVGARLFSDGNVGVSGTIAIANNVAPTSSPACAAC